MAIYGGCLPELTRLLKNPVLLSTDLQAGEKAVV
jgi:hypothetical protein